MENSKDDLPSGPGSGHTARTFVVRSSTRHSFRRHENDGLTPAERDRKSLTTTMNLIRSIGKAKGRIITDEELALKAGITNEQLSAFLSGEDDVPADLSMVLYSAYADLIDRHRMESNRNYFQQTVLLIRNIGLSVGRNITVAEMAGQIGIPVEEVYAYLNDEMDMPQNDITQSLELRYKDLLDDLRTVEIIEDLPGIKRRDPPGV